MHLIKKHYKLIVVFLLLLMLIFEMTSAVQESQTIDEGVHLAAGYSYLTTNDFRMNSEHPPLLKELAAFPLLMLGDRLLDPEDSEHWETRNQWLFAKDILYGSDINPDVILFLGRLPTMLLSIGLGLFLFCWSRKRFGIYGGLISLTIFSFSPTIIAHSRYVTTDIGLSFFFFLTIYYFYKYLKRPTRGTILTAAIFFALTQAAKFSGLVLIGILPILFIIYVLYEHDSVIARHAWKKAASVFLWFTVITCVVVFIVYGFEIKIPIDDPDVIDQYDKRQALIDTNSAHEKGTLIENLAYLTDPETGIGSMVRSFAENVPVPAFSYLKGVVKIFFHNHSGHLAYLNGNFSNFGWWYYFPSAFLMKTPISILALLSLLIVVFTVKCINNKTYKSIKKLFYSIPLFSYFLIVPPMIYLLVSATSHLNLGVRHILPIYPFIFTGLGSLAIVRLKNKKIFSSIIVLLLVFLILSSLSISPHYLAYFNGFFGGPTKGPLHLVDSNVDWGQDVKKLKKYMVSNDIPYVCLSYFGQAKLEHYEIDYRYLPDTNTFSSTNDVNCVVAISVTSLYSEDKKYSWLWSYEPTALIGYSIYIYDFRKQ